MKTNKINVVLSLNKSTVIKYETTDLEKILAIQTTAVTGMSTGKTGAFAANTGTVGMEGHNDYCGATQARKLTYKI